MGSAIGKVEMVLAWESRQLEGLVKPLVDAAGLSSDAPRVKVEPFFEAGGLSVRGFAGETTDAITLGIVSFVVYVVTPILLLLLTWAVGMSVRCSLPIYPLPVTCEAWPDLLVPSQPGTTWRQKIECCDEQRVTIPIPFGASPHAMVALHWFEGGKRFISYERLDGLLFAPRQVTFALPWNVVGPGGCLPKPERDCQYGDTPAIEMAAVSIRCSAENRDAGEGDCHARIAWSFGEHSFTIPRRTAHDGSVVDAGSGTAVMYIASFPHEFNERVPASLPGHPPHFPIELEAVAGPAEDRPTERYPTSFKSAAPRVVAAPRAVASAGAASPLALLGPGLVVLVISTRRAWARAKRVSLL